MKTKKRRRQRQLSRILLLDLSLTLTRHLSQLWTQKRMMKREKPQLSQQPNPKLP